MAGKRANERGVPVVYDPVGVGATRYRNETGERLLKELRLDVVRGNSGEVGALAGAGGVVKGVESVEGVADPQAVARELALRRATVVAITGKRDILSDGTRVLGVDNGHEMLKTITGTGCMATTVVAIFCAVESDRLIAAASALACYGLAAERAARGTPGTGLLPRLAPRRALPHDSRRAREGGARGGSRVGGWLPPRPRRPLRHTPVPGHGCRAFPRAEPPQRRGGGHPRRRDDRAVPGEERLDAPMIEEATELCRLCRAAGIPFIVNDRVDVALAVDADGVHVGQDDMPAPRAPAARAEARSWAYRRAASRRRGRPSRRGRLHRGKPGFFDPHETRRAAAPGHRGAAAHGAGGEDPGRGHRRHHRGQCRGHDGGGRRGDRRGFGHRGRRRRARRRREPCVPPWKK